MRGSPLVRGGMVLFWVAVFFGVGALNLPVVDAILLSALLVAIPTLALAQASLLDGVEIERVPAYWSSIATLWLVGTACWFVGTRNGGAPALGLVGLPAASMALWTLGLTVGALGVIGAFVLLARALGTEDSAVLRQLLPRTQREKGIFALLSVAAGTGEELAYRGYVIPMLAPFLGTLGAAGLSTVVFGTMHAYQGTIGVLRTGIMGGVLAWGFLASGSLWPPILAHTLIDLLAGIVLGERLLVSRTD